jgi:hypothetical protein
MQPMPSHNDAGRRFHEAVRKALQQWFGRPFDMEVSVALPERRPHSFDLASADRDLFVECRLANWQSGTGRLREAIDHLKAVPGSAERLLIIQGDLHPQRDETFAKYFVRLNEDRLGPVNVIEFYESRGSFECLFGSIGTKVEQAQDVAETANPGTAAAPLTAAISVDEFESLGRQLDRILDWVEEMRTRGETRSERIARLRGDDKLPKPIAIQMHTVLKAGVELSNGDAAAVRTAWTAVTDWAKDQGCLVNS